jgi:uncharacterized membrane protein YfcA
MSGWHLVLVGIAGLFAGLINGVVGAGTLITFPLLVALGVPPVLANGTNTTGLFPGAISSAVVYRHSFAEHRRLIVVMALSAAGFASLGAVLVLALPPTVFARVVPILILIAVALVLLQPLITKLIRRWIGHHTLEGFPHRVPSVATASAVGVYGGYFGGGQGIVLMGLLPMVFSPDLQRANGVKNVLAATANATAAAVFIVAGHVIWSVAIVLALTSVAGGWVGSKLAKRLPSIAFRIVIAVVGIVSAIALFLR